MKPYAARLVCHGCGAVVAADAPLSFRCPRASDRDDVDHVLEPELDLATTRFPAADTPSHPFLRYRDLLHVVRAARTRGTSEAEIEDGIVRLDEEVARVDGRGFTETPYEAVAPPEDAPFAALWVKVEAAGVSGSHKARHLFPLALHLEWAGVPRERPLAIASCGNAALAAAVVARAAGRPLEVYVPVDADARVLRRLAELGASVHRVARGADPAARGDPCLRRFREAVRAGAVPFSVQGPENGLVVEGARTIAWEMIDRRRREGSSIPEHVVVQVGGGALLSAVAGGFEVARALGAIERLPRFHAVQGEGAAPFAAAWRRLREAGAGAIEGAARARSEFMRPWPFPPAGVARGIQDDETYDWLVGARAILAGDGRVVTVSDAEVLRAAASARTMPGQAGPPIDETGAAGLAGAVRLARDGVIAADERVAVLFTGRER